MHDQYTQTCWEQDIDLDSDQDSDPENSWVDDLTEEDVLHTEISIREYALDWMDANPLSLASTQVEKQMAADIAIHFLEEWVEADICDETEDNYQFLLDWVKQTVVDMNLRNAPVFCSPTLEPVADRVQRLDDAPNPEQRTQAWYDFRYNLLTASNLWKALGTDAQKNSLIYEKCRPYSQFVEECAKHKNLGTDNSMHWGQKYEPVSLQIYEHRNQVHVNQYGCIVHREHAFLGASPDGISGSGKMLEIKNIVNREITGVPLDAYWIQMQIQMEVCDLDECDFVETRFKEFADEEAFLASTAEDKGVMLRFVQRRTLDDIINPTPDSLALEPFYEYAPLGVVGKEWIQECREKHAPKYVLAHTVYWYLDQYSCVLVRRNRDWFQAALPKIRDVWDTVLRERETGCEHRAPNKRKNPVSKNVESGGYTINMPVLSGGLCLVKLDS